MVTFVDGQSDPVAQQRGDELFAQIFFTEEGTANPLPLYELFRNEVPIHVSDFTGVVFTRYDDCRRILRDGRFGNGDSPQAGSFGTTDEISEYRIESIKRRKERPLSMLGLDPPSHTRQRSLVSRAFTPRTIERLRPRVAKLVDGMIDDMIAGSGHSPGGLVADAAGTASFVVDAMETIAKPLPVTVISEMLGVPAEDWPTIREQVTDLVLGLEPNATLEDLQLSDAAGDVLWAYFTDLITKRRADPQDDLISGLIAVSDGDDTLSEGEILAVAVLLFAAGAETTTNLIGNGLHQLLLHPEQRDLVWNDPSLVPSMVEEVLRHDSPVQLDGRTCLEPAEFAGLAFEPGDRVITLLGAANHDPDHYPDAGTFDVTRFVDGKDAEPVMSFASGIHYCLGANLARVEGQEVFSGLIRRFGPPADAGERNYRNRLVLRGLQSCPIALTPRR